jgi:quercetin dioxygenase-like cupin family protein
MMVTRRTIRVVCVIGALVAWALSADPGWAQEYRSVVSLLDTKTTNIGQPIQYPSDPARVVSAIVTLRPGEETGRHRHAIPTYGYILEGEVTIDYDSVGAKTFGAGEAFIEAQNWWHNGRNTGGGPARILVVFIGTDGTPNVERSK